MGHPGGFLSGEENRQGRVSGEENRQGRVSGEENRQRLVPGEGNRRYFLSRGRTRGRIFFATILLPSAVAWVLSACIMPSTP